MSDLVLQRGGWKTPPPSAAPVRSAFRVKVASHDPILVQLSFKVSFRMMEKVGVHTIQLSHPIISR